MPYRIRMTFSSRGVSDGQRVFDLQAERRALDGVARAVGVGVLDEVDHRATRSSSLDPGVEAHRLLGHGQELLDLVGGDLEAGGDLGHRGLAAERLEHQLLRLVDPVDDLELVDRDPDGADLRLDGADDGLADPPARVGRELESPVWSNFSTAFIRPRLPSWMRSGIGRPR
jgi:hypothetical protein